MGKPKFKYGQFIVKQMQEVKKDWIFYRLTNNLSYGVFKITPYAPKDVNGDPYEFDITYKVSLIPVGEYADKFPSKIDYYTNDLRDVPKEMIFDDENLADKFVKEFPIENIKPINN